MTLIKNTPPFMRIKRGIMDREIKELEAKIKDLLRLSEKHSSPKFTAFLNEEEQAGIDANIALGYNFSYYGGYEGARRKMFGVFPDWQEVDFSEYPIDIIKFEKKYKKELTHRDYLGTILSAGIERNTVGDILVTEWGAYVFILKSVSGHILGQIEKIANCGVKTELVGADEVEIPKQEYDDLFKVVASMRLDAFVAAITNQSRNTALLMIKGQKVALNHKEITDGAKSVSVGDVISVRGFGRFVVWAEGSRTGSGRLHVHIKKFR